MKIISKVLCFFNKHRWITISENVKLNNCQVTCKECAVCGAFEYDQITYTAYEWALDFSGYNPQNEI